MIESINDIQGQEVYQNTEEAGSLFIIVEN